MKHQREIFILDYINSKGSVSNAELIEKFKISKATLNRDLTALENDNAIKKVHGGALSLNTVQTFELPIKKKELLNSGYKEAIARESLPLIHDDQVIILDSGSTTLELARLIAKKHWSNLTVVTNDIKIMWTLAENDTISLFVLGGEKYPKSYNVFGSSYTMSPLKNVHVDLCFLGTAAFHPDNGVTYVLLEEAELKQAMMHCSDKVVLMADSSKYNQVKRWNVCDLSELSYIITDSRLGTEGVNKLKAKCSQVVISEEENG